MTAAAHSRAAAHSHASAEPPRLNWSMVGVVVGIALHLAAGVWFASSLSQRVSALEEAVPPGSIQRLDERTLQIQRALERLEARP